MSTEEAVLVSTECKDALPRRHRRHPPMRSRIPGRSASDTDIILPKWVYFKDRKDRYLVTSPSVNNLANLVFDSVDSPNTDCIFEVEKCGNSQYRFIDKDGLHFVRFGSGEGVHLIRWYSTDDTGSPGSFNIIIASGNTIYLKDNYSPSLFFSGDLEPYLNAPTARNYINEASQIQLIQAAAKNEITDVEYDIPGGKVHDVAPLIALSTSVQNNSDGDANQTLSYSYEKWSAGTWNNSAGIEIGTGSVRTARSHVYSRLDSSVRRYMIIIASTTIPFVSQSAVSSTKMSIEAEVPFVKSTLEISVSTSYSHQWGGEVGTREVVTSSTTITVPPKKRARATIIVRNAQIDVGFTYTQRILWSNGESEDEKKSGVYNNVDSYHVDVVLDNWEDV